MRRGTIGPFRQGMYHRVTRWVLGTLLASVCLVDPGSVSAQSSDVDLTITRVRDRLYVISGPADVNTGNVAALVTEEGVILVDDKFDRHVAAIQRAVRTLTDQPIRYVLNTHHHLDHSGGNRTLRTLAEIIAHRNARENMVGRSGSYGSGRPEPDLPRVTFNEVTSIFLGGKEVRAYYFGRGHTNGDAVIYFPDEGVVHTGDLYVPGGFLTDYAAGGGALEWGATLEAILDLDFDTVIPGHLRISVPREELAQHVLDFETVRERVRQIIVRDGGRKGLAGQLQLEDLAGWSEVPWIPTSPFLMRSFEGLYDELLQRQER